MAICEECEKWKRIAIEERSKYHEQAAKELDLQGYKTAYEPNGPIEINGERYVKESEQKAYIDWLEDAFIKLYKLNLEGMDSATLEKHAINALKMIREKR